MKNNYKMFLSVLLFIAAMAGTAAAQTVIYSENFESGTANAQWETYYKNEDKLKAVPIAQAPKTLATGGSFVGLLQDIDGTFSGSAVAVRGDAALKDYSIEADVYVYINQSLSAYTGLVVYADSSKKDFYKLRADFDANNRINFSGLKSDPNTFLPLFSKDFTGANNTGLFPTVDGWVKLKIEVRNTSATQTSIWAYMNGTLLKNSPLVDTASGRNTSGKYGLYSFQSDSNGIPAYFDNIVVSTLPVTGVFGNQNVKLPEGFGLEQNYPNPFNPETRITYRTNVDGYVSLAIFDALGREVNIIVSGNKSAGVHTAQWNGKDESGKIAPSGIYYYTLRSGSNVETKKMVLMK
ncbi:MAG: FlgD immunoglobulin-like domain containing protein [Bacteroidota bacterium]